MPQMDQAGCLYLLQVAWGVDWESAVVADQALASYLSSVELQPSSDASVAAEEFPAAVKINSIIKLSSYCSKSFSHNYEELFTTPINLTDPLCFHLTCAEIKFWPQPDINRNNKIIKENHKRNFSYLWKIR